MVKTSIIVIVFLVVGYLLGNFVPLQNFSSSNQGNPTVGNQENDSTKITSIPSGKGILEVTVKNSSNQPMVGIEIDVGVRPGPPESWGVKEANVNGTANFELAPGDYYVYFNMNRFPSGYKIQPGQKVSVQEGQIKNLTIVLEKI
ncbi:MAG: carboxypeptidase-like regulatory domain-containing protein [Candidatus Paceibacterota bacterium]